MLCFYLVSFVLIFSCNADSLKDQLGYEDRIVGGTIAFPHSWPAHVLIIQRYTGEYEVNNERRKITKSSYCGGTLVDSQTVLTAAHCVLSEFKEDGKTYSIVLNKQYPTFESMFTVYLGVHDLNFLNSTELPSSVQVLSVARITKHKSFVKSTLQNDLALMRLSIMPELNRYVQIASLPPQSFGTGYPKAGLTSFAIGWGRTATDGPRANQLQIVSLETISCSQKPLVCTATAKDDGLASICYGDSGGGLYLKEDEKIYLIGVGSFVGEECSAARDAPNGFSRISYYQDWLQKNSASIGNLKLYTYAVVVLVSFSFI